MAAAVHFSKQPSADRARSPYKPGNRRLAGGRSKAHHNGVVVAADYGTPMRGAAGSTLSTRIYRRQRPRQMGVRSGGGREARFKAGASEGFLLAGNRTAIPSFHKYTLALLGWKLIYHAGGTGRKGHFTAAQRKMRSAEALHSCAVA